MAARLEAALAETARGRALAAHDRETDAAYWRAVAELCPAVIPEMPKPKRRRDVAAQASEKGWFQRYGPTRKCRRPGYAPDAGETCCSRP